MKKLLEIIEIITKACGSLLSFIYQRRVQLGSLVVFEYEYL